VTTGARPGTRPGLLLAAREFTLLVSTLAPKL